MSHRGAAIGTRLENARRRPAREMAWRLVWGVALLAGACAAPERVPGGAVRESGQEIFGGVPSSGDPAVLSLGGSGFLCTGTLIHPRVVLTAGHCVDGGAPTIAAQGSRADAPDRLFDVTDSVLHPAYDAEEFWLADVGVLILAKPVTHIVPHTFQRTPLGESDLGAAVRFVGFGDRGDGGFGEKYTRTSSIDLIEPQFFEYGTAVCEGDSGGPAFRRQGGVDVVVGVTSYTYECGGAGGSLRTDHVAEWLDEQIAAVEGTTPPTCAADGQCATPCVVTDPDCEDDEVDDPGRVDDGTGVSPPVTAGGGTPESGGGCAIARAQTAPSGTAWFTLVVVGAALLRRRRLGPTR